MLCQSRPSGRGAGEVVAGEVVWARRVSLLNIVLVATAAIEVRRSRRFMLLIETPEIILV